jgi:putative ABC transport system permease protein
MVVGVVGEVRDMRLPADPVPMVYLDHEQLPWPLMTLIIRTTGDPALTAAAVRRAVSAADPGLPAPAIGVLDSSMDEQLAGPRLNTQLLGLFSCMALLIAAMGVYGVIAYRVARRRYELGVRMAIGAECRDLVALVLRQGLQKCKRCHVSHSSTLGVASDKPFKSRGISACSSVARCII